MPADKLLLMPAPGSCAFFNRPDDEAAGERDIQSAKRSNAGVFKSRRQSRRSPQGRSTPAMFARSRLRESRPIPLR
jgi:hypothetical protein